MLSGIYTQGKDICNAWELSQIAEWKDENEKLTARITELKEFIDQLIEAGKGLLDSLCTDPEEEKTVEVMNWKAVVDKVNKERER